MCDDFEWGISVRQRVACRVCGGNRLHKWVHLPLMPLTDDLRTWENQNNAFLYDLDIYLCQDCQTAQLLHDVSMTEYYRDYTYTSGGSAFAKNFMERLCRAIFEKYNLPKKCKVIEIGSGDGDQLSQFKAMGADVYGCEPSQILCEVSKEKGIPVYNGLFSQETVKQIPQHLFPVDVVLLTYTFDHIPDPVDFLRTAHQILNVNTGLLVIEVHDLDQIVQRREFCLFAHEHFTYLCAETMSRILNRSGFQLISTNLLPDEERRGNSLLVVATPYGSLYDRPEFLMQKDQQYIDGKLLEYDKFNKSIEMSIVKLDNFVNFHVSAGRKIAGYGAGGRGVMTLAAMNSGDLFSYICDQNKNFHGKNTPKSQVPIVPPEWIEENPVDVLLVFSFGYIKEIQEKVCTMKNSPSLIVSLLDVL